MTQPAPPRDALRASARPWRFSATEQCFECGEAILYQPVEGWDPATDDGDNDGWTVNAQGERTPQIWRKDLTYDGAPWVCADPTCRARGHWIVIDGSAAPEDVGETLDEITHAQILAEALAEPSDAQEPS